MKKIGSFFAAIGLSLAITTSAFAATTFSDIGKSYAKNEIMALTELGVINGYPDGTFKPTKSITRDEFAKIICVGLDLPEIPEAAAKFKDVEDWARGYVGTLTAVGVLNGYSETSFGGKDTLTREQMATIFVRIMGKEIADFAYEEGDIKCNFKDNAQIDAYAKSSVAYAQAIGFIKGDGTNFNPDGQADRQAVARLMYEYLLNSEAYDAPITEIYENLTEEHQAIIEEIYSVYE